MYVTLELLFLVAGSFFIFLLTIKKSENILKVSVVLMTNVFFLLCSCFIFKKITRYNLFYSKCVPGNVPSHIAVTKKQLEQLFFSSFLSSHCSLLEVVVLLLDYLAIFSFVELFFYVEMVLVSVVAVV